MADLRHAISQVENSITDEARIRVGKADLLWTNELVTAMELRELYDEEHLTDVEFLGANKVIAVCSGQWHREGMEYRLYKDPEIDDA